MSKSGNILFFVLLFVLQIVVNDYIHLGPYVFVCLIPFILLNIPLTKSPHKVMLIAFAIGFLLDVLSDGVTGLNACAAVLTVATRKFFYKLLVNSDPQDKTEIPGISNIGLAKYVEYLSVMIAVYLAAYIFVDCVSFRPFSFMFLKFAISTAINILISLLVGVPLVNKE